MPQEIILEDDESALILSPDGKCQMFLPEYGDNEDVPHTTTLMITIGALMKREDEGLQVYLANQWNEILKESISEEEWNELQAQDSETETICIPEADREGG